MKKVCLVFFAVVAALNWPLWAGENVVEKKFAPFPGGELRQLAPKRGGCIATDMITVDGRKVRFMYREKPDNKLDSGWRFMSGYESDSYMNDQKNHGVYDVNTIANYDPDILPFLDSPVGSAFEWAEGNRFVPVEFSPPE